MAISADDAPKLASSVIILTAVALITYTLRVYCRVSRRLWAAEDWIMTAAVAPFCVLVVGCLGGAFNGIGIRSWRLQQSENVKYQVYGQKFFLIFEVGYCAAIIPIKLSISWMLIRIAEGRKVYVYIQYIIIALFASMNFIALIFILTDCIPVEAAWDKSLLENGGRCQPPQVLADVYYACTAVNIATDWVTALMPIPLLWNVKLGRNSKLSVMGLMSLGILASLSACVRLNYTVNLTNQEEFLFAVANVVIWGFAENAIGMTVGNIATLRPLFRNLLDNSRAPGYSSRPSRLGSGFELSQHGKSGTTYATTLTEVKGSGCQAGSDRRDRDSQLSDSDSRKMILDGNATRQGANIVVSRQVNVSYE
ncbi:hypothetical protein BDW68DRAFT_183125 [Aspergillus falconensis]